MISKKLTIYDLEDYLFIMFKVTYEIEMHINAIISLDNIISPLKFWSSQFTEIIHYHNELALIRSEHILKRKPKREEKHSLFTLKNILNGMNLNTPGNELKEIFNKIDMFYKENEIDLCKIVNLRDAEAHGGFKQTHDFEINAYYSISFIRHKEIIHTARNLIMDLHNILFKREFPKLLYDVNLYDKIYRSGIQINSK